jgi:hypothetical protein
MKMNNAAFGELFFNIGWKTKANITLFGNSYDIVIKAKAYFEKDGVTTEQENAYRDFISNKPQRLAAIEKSLNDFSNDGASKRFVPRTLLFQRDGSYALLLDDKEDEDDGVAVCFTLKVEVISQDEYL